MHARKHVCTYKRVQRFAQPARTSKLAEASIGQWLPAEAAIRLQVSQSVAGGHTKGSMYVLRMHTNQSTCIRLPRLHTVSMYPPCQPEILPSASACASSEIAVGGPPPRQGEHATGEHATGEVPPPPLPAQTQQLMNGGNRYKYIYA